MLQRWYITASTPSGCIRGRIGREGIPSAWRQGGTAGHDLLLQFSDACSVWKDDGGISRAVERTPDKQGIRNRSPLIQKGRTPIKIDGANLVKDNVHSRGKNA